MNLDTLLLPFTFPFPVPVTAIEPAHVAANVTFAAVVLSGVTV